MVSVYANIQEMKNKEKCACCVVAVTELFLAWISLRNPIYTKKVIMAYIK